MTAVSACQTIADKRKIDYKSTRTLPPLEIPPDLSAPATGAGPAEGTGTPGGATYSGLVTDKGAGPKSAVGAEVLPDYDDIRLMRDGRMRWLVVKARPEQLWPQVREFVLANGLVIDKENPQTGFIETDWAENRANIGTGSQKVLAKWMKGLYSTGLQDKYRIRLERGTTPETTDVYISHFGMEEVLVGTASSDQPGDSKWQPRAPDPGLEVEMMRLLMAHLGVKDEKAASVVAAATTPAPDKAKLNRSETGVSLTLSESLDRAWRLVGLALDRSSFTVQDRDRSKGIYYVRYIDPDKIKKKKGFFRRMFSSDDKKDTDEYQIHLKGSDTSPSTDIEVLGKDGASENSPTGERILTLLHEQLK
jgi:outer membrane protein assembly factor BamC